MRNTKERSRQQKKWISLKDDSLDATWQFLIHVSSAWPRFGRKRISKVKDWSTHGCCRAVSCLYRSLKTLLHQSLWAEIPEKFPVCEPVFLFVGKGDDFLCILLFSWNRGFSVCFFLCDFLKYVLTTLVPAVWVHFELRTCTTFLGGFGKKEKQERQTGEEKEKTPLPISFSCSETRLSRGLTEPKQNPNTLSPVGLAEWLRAWMRQNCSAMSM